MIKKYVKKPLQIEAIKLTNENAEKCVEWCSGMYNKTFETSRNNDKLVKENLEGIDIITEEGVMLARIEDYIIKGINGEFYPCKSDIFEKSYKELSNENHKELEGISFVQDCFEYAKRKFKDVKIKSTTFCDMVDEISEEVISLREENEEINNTLMNIIKESLRISRQQ